MSPLNKASNIKKPSLTRLFNIWWAYLDLNQGPIDYESTALTN